MSRLAVRCIGFDNLYLDRRQWESASHRHSASFRTILKKRLRETHIIPPSALFGKTLWRFRVVEGSKKRHKMSFYIPVSALLL
ncbi:hypothetical protein IG631_22340 [Alternaria alternata]|nr:hypothetical protein IG631_22340 [Alternaria alternata]